MLCMCWDDQAIMDQYGKHVDQCGTTGAAEMAQAAGVKQLVLSHMGPRLRRHGPLEKGIGDVRRLFDGELLFAEGLLTFDV